MAVYSMIRFNKWAQQQDHRDIESRKKQKKSLGKKAADVYVARDHPGSTSLPHAD